MDCCLHQLVFTVWPCTMLLCFSRLRVTVVTPGHSHVTLLAPLCAASQLWLTAHSALSLPPCCTAVHTVHNAAHLYTAWGEHWPSLHRIQAQVLIIPHHHYHHYHHLGPHRAPHPGTLSLCMNKSRVSWPTALLSPLSWWLTTPSKDNTRRFSLQQYNSYPTPEK